MSVGQEKRYIILEQVVPTAVSAAICRCVCTSPPLSTTNATRLPGPEVFHYCLPLTEDSHIEPDRQ
jgi:hypothetical protein